MWCVFCERNTSQSRSVEHIIPESLGNKEHILERGIICDNCNNYFASKIEGPVLSSIHFQNLRSRQGIANKRGTIPFEYGIFPQAGIPIALRASLDQGTSVGAWHEKDDARFVQTLMGIGKGTFLVPLSAPVDERLLARFIAKIGVEAYVAKALEADITVDQIIASEELKSIRRFVRRGDWPEKWPVSRRRIYHEEAIFSEGESAYQVLHEYSLLVTDEIEIYAVICIFGEEFAINLGGPSTDGYGRWLSANGNRSPLYI
ncbi:HNH endonuclease [Rhizobium lentis]|uniref:HNH endonuclease n=1 Tax=Rhizobium lentis TaxID=1138194 RepID=UPI001C836EA2|nr:HNH endonuclease [Rhizobium lentis]MBX4959526.1 HNH endonuclease [Rhizobium lentis]MBX5032611.1 HNH endonuclease [Rhizobium lentis]